MTYDETLSYIYNLGMFSLPSGLERMTEVAKRLSNPQNDFRSIHIAGTNGKGSTAVMCAGVFAACGLKTGLFISPYIVDFRERIQINGKMIDKQSFVRLSKNVIDTGIKLTTFEFVTAVCFLYFSEQKCDIAVIETGLGGRLDATNVISNVAVSVITKIGLDHTALLGDTLEKIAAEKCGIIKNSVTVTSAFQEDKAFKVIEKAAKKLIVPDRSELCTISQDFGNTFLYKGERYEIRLAGEHQLDNATCAIEAVKASGIDISAECLKTGLKNAFIPARLETVSENPTVIIDGAHNPDAARVISSFLDKSEIKPNLIIGMMRDKDVEEFLKIILCKFKKVITVSVENNERSMSAQELSDIAKKYHNDVRTANSYKQALMLSGENTVFALGSLYLAADIRKLYI